MRWYVNPLTFLQKTRCWVWYLFSAVGCGNDWNMEFKNKNHFSQHIEATRKSNLTTDNIIQSLQKHEKTPGYILMTGECCLNVQIVVLCIRYSALLKRSKLLKYIGSRYVFIIHSNSIYIAVIRYVCTTSFPQVAAFIRVLSMFSLEI